MHVVMVTVGTRGDVQPFVALGKGLSRAGYRVTLATHDDYASFVAEHGLGFRAIGGSFKKIIESDLGREWIESSGSFFRFLELSRRVFEPLVAPWIRDAHDAVSDADALVFSARGWRGAYEGAEKRGVPRIGVGLFPVWPNGDHSVMAPRAPWRWLRRWVDEQAVRGLAKMGRQTYDDHRRDLGLAPFRTANPLREMLQAGVHFLHLYSGHLLGRRPSEWPASIHVTGACTLDTTPGWVPPEDLRAFLDAGPPPVYIGFGSMTGRSPEDLARLVLEAVALSGRRAIVATGWGGIASTSRPRDVLVIDGAPHEWLFPRCSAVVHHGGAGTVATGLAAGRPTAVVAFVGDQPYWGHRIHALGAGPPPILRRDLTAPRLASAIRRVVSEESYRRSAESVAAALAKEDGVAAGVRTIREIVSG